MAPRVNCYQLGGLAFLMIISLTVLQQGQEGYNAMAMAWVQQKADREEKREGRREPFSESFFFRLFS
jgi:acyl-CoA thioesterase